MLNFLGCVRSNQVRDSFSFSAQVDHGETERIETLVQPRYFIKPAWDDSVLFRVGEKRSVTKVNRVKFKRNEIPRLISSVSNRALEVSNSKNSRRKISISFQDLSLEEFVHSVYRQLQLIYLDWSAGVHPAADLSRRLFFSAGIVQDLLNQEAIPSLRTLQSRWQEVLETHSVKHSVDLAIDKFFSDDKLNLRFSDNIRIGQLPRYLMDETRGSEEEESLHVNVLFELFQKLDFSVAIPSPIEVRNLLKEHLNQALGDSSIEILREEVLLEAKVSALIEMFFEASDFLENVELWLTQFNSKRLS